VGNNIAFHQNRSVTTNHGHVTVTANGLQATPAINNVVPGIGGDAHIVNVTITPNEIGNFDFSAGVTAGSVRGSAGVNRETLEGQFGVGASIVSGSVRGSVTTENLVISVSGTARLGLEYGGHFTRDGDNTIVDIRRSKGPVSGAVQVHRRMD